jgi:DNA-binding beta-propeller fold protein YncE
VANAFDRRLFLAALGSAGLTACSGGAAPSAPYRPGANAATRGRDVTRVYDSTAWDAAFSPKAKNLYVAGGEALAIVGPTGTKLYRGSGIVHLEDCRAVASDTINGGGYLADVGLGTIYRFLDTGEFREVTKLFGNPVGIAFESESQKLYVCNGVGNNPEYDNAVIEVALPGFEVKTLAKTKGPRGVAVDRISKMVYVADYNERSILTIDGKGTIGALGSDISLAKGVARRTGRDTFVVDSNGLYQLSEAGEKKLISADPSYTGVSVDEVNGDLYVSLHTNGVIRFTGV